MRAEQTHRLILNAALMPGQTFQRQGPRIDFGAYVTDDAFPTKSVGKEEEKTSKLQNWVYFALKVIYLL